MAHYTSGLIIFLQPQTNTNGIRLSIDLLPGGEICNSCVDKDELISEHVDWSATFRLLFFQGKFSTSVKSLPKRSISHSNTDFYSQTLRRCFSLNVKECSDCTILHLTGKPDLAGLCVFPSCTYIHVYVCKMPFLFNCHSNGVVNQGGGPINSTPVSSSTHAFYAHVTAASRSFSPFCPRKQRETLLFCLSFLPHSIIGSVDDTVTSCK